MKNEIHIICNSPEALEEISAGRWPELHKKNIFTCNLAYTHFRTSARHLNIFSDAIPIKDFLFNKNWPQIYGAYNYSGIEFIFNLWKDGKGNDVHIIDIICNKHPFKINLKAAPDIVPASSAIGALFYLNAIEKFDKIHLIGYTLNEWEGIENVKELSGKNQAFKDLFKNYQEERPRPCVFTYTRRFGEVGELYFKKPIRITNV
jgi:hypothetical protein